MNAAVITHGNVQHRLEMFKFTKKSNYACLKFNLYCFLPHTGIHFIRTMLPTLRAKHEL